ncbi:sugar-binding transcriptional regulator [Tropicimonas sediminicola]|uniref:DNA-binding transcriptional regulator LsrR, DeoR family n=1 Tax=Tropicimonas sediminicola TaxID=1031541 RepID=A0A239C8L5_9RHOB|nr:sugar-binding domain-containing protein [Tropicimonas sediminicola]SNS16577.1 DNA-binding transcriptional regulator LsrR, DeoR family [Tropicimonas sediminicola]
MNDLKAAVFEATPLDQAARAAWLYYVGQKTQDQIAQELGISRQRAQRLVARAVSEGLIHFHLDHRIARCLEMEAEFMRRGLRLCRVAPSLGEGAQPLHAIAPIAAAEIERILSVEHPLVVAVGTGRAMRAAVEQVPTLNGAHHQIVSLNGNISPDGSASHFDVLMRLADRVGARQYPMPLPVIASSEDERELFHSLGPVRRNFAMARKASVTFVGIGQASGSAPMLKDGFLTAEELEEIRMAGGIGEIVGWYYDESGSYLDGGPNRRVAGVRVDPPSEDKLVVGVAGGLEKLPAILGAISGKIVNGLVTDEQTAEALLSQ